MITMIFRDADGLIIPALPSDRNGNLRTVDGTTCMNLEQAAAHFGVSADRLALLWRETFSDMLGDVGDYT
jgi:hypothetical protein